MRSRDAAYFEDLYKDDPDPWRFATCTYERRKYADTLAALEGRRFARALEVGCSIGVLTRSLAGRCDSLLAIDIAEAPLAAARARCHDRPQVSFAQVGVPADFPAGPFDLIVLSEVLYFLAPHDIERLAQQVLATLEPGGQVLLVNWLGATDQCCTGHEAATLFIAAAAGRLVPVIARRQPSYRLDVLAAGSARL